MGWDIQTERGRDLLDMSSETFATEGDDESFAESGRSKFTRYKSTAELLTQRVAGELTLLARCLADVWEAVKPPPQQKKHSSILSAMAVGGQPIPLTAPAPSGGVTEKQETALRKVRSGA